MFAAVLPAIVLGSAAFDAHIAAREFDAGVLVA
jgi:hypothetical protein